MNKEKRLAYSAWLAVCFLWGTGYLAMRIGVADFPPMLFSGLRILGAGIVLTAIMIIKGHSLPHGKDWLHLAIVGIMLEGVSNCILGWSAQWIPSGLMGLLMAMTPFWMVGIEAFTGGEKLTLKTILGLFIGFLGLFLLVFPQLRDVSFDPKFLASCLLIQVVCISFGAGSVYAKRKPVQVSPLMGAGIQMLVTGGVVTIFGTFLGEWEGLHFSLRPVIALVYMLIFGSLIGYSAYIYSLQKLPISIVSLHRYVNPVVAVFLGWLILNEKFTWLDSIAVGLIFIGVVFVQVRGSGIKRR